jgi:CspA family cold shock protein
VESLQVAAELSSALKVYWFLTYWSRKSLRKELIGLKGTIKRVIRERGFGFISAEDEREIFFHRSVLEGIDFDALEEGNSVEFNVERGPKGPRAVNVRMIKAQPKAKSESTDP